MDADKSDVKNELIKKADEAFEDALDTTTNKIDNIVENIKNDEVREIAEIAVDVGAAVAENVGEDLINMAGDKVFEQLEKKAKEVGIKRNTLTVLLRFTMEAIEDTPIKGIEQRDYAIKLLKALVESQAEDPERAILLNVIDSGILEDTIDLIVSASRGELKLNQVGEAAVSCCLSFLSKRSKKKD
tara:strand:- start:3638 stop:4195 length:558 start_codon:yes stop_codon:yes gene_type:complete